MYGMGNGADKILNICNGYGIEIKDFFASDGFVRGHNFHGKTVLSYAEIKEKYEKFIVLLSFASSLDSVIDNIEMIEKDSCCELYAPDVPVFGENLFDMEFYKTHKSEIEKVYSILADDISKEIYNDIILFKLSGKISYLTKWNFSIDEVFNSILNVKDIVSYADLGAYNGDTIKELVPYTDKLSRVIALEPDKRNFKKLTEYAQSVIKPLIKSYQVGAWDREATLCFSNSGNRNANIQNYSQELKKLVEVGVNSLDNILSGENIDYIKFDVEGAEKEAILGSKRTIENFHPKLNVSVYHRSEDIFTLPLLIHEMFPFYSLYIRKRKYIPAWDVGLYCVGGNGKC